VRLVYYEEESVSYINRMGYRLRRWFDALTRGQEKHDKFFVDSKGKIAEYEGPACEKRADWISSYSFNICFMTAPYLKRG
jgi:hypothetical protein